MTTKSTTLLIAASLAAFAACGDDGNSTAVDGPTPVVDAPVTVDAPPAATSVSLATTGGLGAHLVDKDGKSLYFFANDVPGTNKSEFSGAAWPPFDVQSPTVGAGLTATDFGRFDRGGGVFQATWKGRPLYYFANDTAATPTAGEGTGGRWFVARAYNLFFAASGTVTPQGGAAASAPFLTNGAGRSLYITSQDTRGAGGTAPVSYCSDAGSACVTTWPLWEKPATLTDVVVPSTITAADLTTFTSFGKQQFAYKGWPLYFFGADTAPGQVIGATKPTWFAVNPAWNGTIVTQ
jgi:predicted lipoprotein with Yx(FWY)xxD motif